MEQRTEDWLKARLGHVTASRIDSVLAQGKKPGEPSAMRMQYLWQLVLERHTGLSKENSYASKAMQNGIEREPTARLAYELTRGVEVEEVGFITHPRIKFAGCSPDGLVGDNGLIELKCPDPWRFGEAALGAKPDRKEVNQCQWQMACTGRKWVDLMIYSEGCDLVINQVQRDDDAIRTLENAVTVFLREVEATLLAYRDRWRNEAA